MFRIGLENNTEGRSQAWVLGHPGCFSYGVDGAAALEAVPKAIKDYRAWIAKHSSENWLPGSDTEYRLEETWECYSINDEFELVQDGYEVNAWFRHDWIPLNDEDIRRGLLLLSWGREELLKTVSPLKWGDPGAHLPQGAVEHCRHPQAHRWCRMVVPGPARTCFPA